ncbi:MULTISPECIES: methionine adenosyltransferase [Limnochorda]|uniref:methionine adenosyltransferase n=1 Tax=Limnochorda TaxID=1676651 RepID=UPI001E01C9EE|nr:methionine adenosyltransferase [Limnochorda pilosa]MBO2486899.1 methionine adenosyltransferase [Bacillota bacterium]MBO2519370.1 methionine adenosyltransferase [Bacillota bacterium]
MGESRRRFFTSESVTEGHPDKLCDQVSDAVLDAILAQDPEARVACEVSVTTGLLLVMGEISTSCYVDIPTIARETVRSIGYDRAKYGFDAETCAVLNSIQEQSPDIAVGVGRSLEARQASHDPYDAIGAGDQGMMFGYACDETEELMPAPIALAHSLARRLAQVRKDGTLPYLRPDGKTQVTVEYEDDRPVRVETIVVSAQHSPDISQKELAEDIIEHVVQAVIPADLMDEKTKILVNPTGRFVVGGPQGDTGLTGRKIIVDTYGGMARHGGGAFSGKDPTKVDRSASYAARYVAKNMVAAGLARRLELWISYAIGVARPLAIGVDSFGTGTLPDEELARLAAQVFDFRPAAIIERLQLRRPIYRQVAAYGHFGRPDLDLPWERLDLVPELR